MSLVVTGMPSNYGSIVIFATGLLVTLLAPPKSCNSNTFISTGKLYLTLGRAITLDVYYGVR